VTDGGGSLPAAVRTLPGVQDPLSLLERVEREPYPALLFSGRVDRDAGRFSVIASDPFQILRFRRGRGILKSRRREVMLEGDPWKMLRQALDPVRVPGIPGIPFAGGAIGYLGYGLGRCAVPWRRGAPPSEGPELHLAFYDRAFVVDHLEHCTHLVATGLPETAPARQREKQMLDLARLIRTAASGPPRPSPRRDPAPSAPSFRTSLGDYLRAIRRAKEHLSEGEIYQVNLSHRVEVEGDWDPFPLYRKLMDIHGARFSAYLALADRVVLCASPERLVRLEGKRAETRPIKGTRARSADPGEDVRAAETLALAPKERAENVMIVDLARNDLGRVCAPGSVKVEDLCRVESLPSVHHLVSRVSGILRSDRDRVDLVRALFPGGSMTGAPKIRAMEIIDELEGGDRGIYSGSVGYFSFDGDLDLNIVIRTVILRQGAARLQVGGAILVDSDPEGEYQETLDKARPILDLLQRRGPDGEGEHA